MKLSAVLAQAGPGLGFCAGHTGRFFTAGRMGSPNLELRAEIRKLLRHGRLYRGRWLHVRVSDSHLSRAIISVRKKYGGAVLRNRGRRRLRSICRELGLDRLPGRLLLVSLGDHASGAKYCDLRLDLIGASRVLGIRGI